MPPTIDNAFIEEYRNLVIHLAQQGDARIRPHVMEVQSSGEAYNWDRLGPTDAQEKVGRRVDTPYIDDDWTRRVAVPRTFNHNMTFEHEDKVQMIIDPQSAYANNQAMAMKREYDDLVIEAATSDALNGDGALNPFPLGQIVGNGTLPFSFDGVTEVQEIFMQNEITMDVPKVMVVGPTQVRAGLQLAEATNSDFVMREALQNLSQYGFVPNWMGFDWVMSNRLLAPAGGQLSCLAFTKMAIGLAVNDNMMVRIGEDPGKSYMNQVYAQFTAGAVRIEDEHIVQWLVADTVA